MVSGISWKIFLVIFGIFYDNIWHFRPRNSNIHIPNINSASTRSSGSLFLGFKLKLFRFQFSEGSAGISKVRPESGTFGWNFKRSAGILNVRPESRKFTRNSEHWRPAFGPFMVSFCFSNSRWLMCCSFPSHAVWSVFQHTCRYVVDREFDISCMEQFW